jgi:hypothetical protein
VIVQLLGAGLLVLLGVLLGSTWTMQFLQPRLCRQAEERRRLNEEWVAVRAVRQRWGECPRCGRRLGDCGRLAAPAAVEYPRLGE